MDSRHARHQVAMKSRSTTFPRKSETRIDFMVCVSHIRKSGPGGRARVGGVIRATTARTERPIATTIAAHTILSLVPRVPRILKARGAVLPVGLLGVIRSLRARRHALRCVDLPHRLHCLLLVLLLQGRVDFLVHLPL